MGHTVVWQVVRYISGRWAAIYRKIWASQTKDKPNKQTIESQTKQWSDFLSTNVTAHDSKNCKRAFDLINTCVKKLSGCSSWSSTWSRFDPDFGARKVFSKTERLTSSWKFNAQASLISGSFWLREKYINWMMGDIWTFLTFHICSPALWLKVKTQC